MTTATRTSLPPDMEFLFERLEYAPNSDMQARILACQKRFILVQGGEQGGKSLTLEKKTVSLIFELLHTIDTVLVWLVAADYERTRPEFEYLVEDFVKLFGINNVTASKRVDPGYIEITLKGHSKPRIKIETKSAKDPRTLYGYAPNIILGCEASQLDLETYNRLQGRAAPRRGYLLLGGTLESSLGWYPQLYDAWEHGTKDEQSFRLPSYLNIELYPGGIDDPEIQRLKANSSDDFFLERIEGQAVPPTGLVFKEFRVDIHVRDIEYMPGIPIHLWVDPGYAGAYAVMAAHIINGQVQFFDSIYEQGLVTEEICQIVAEKPWFKDVKHGVMDIAGLQHQAMPAPVEIWLAKPPKGIGLYMSTNRVLINDGIERLKGFLKPNPLTNQPKIVIAPHCKGILSEFGAVPNPFDGQTRAYRWKTDREGNIVGDVPDDRHNHGIKAVIYGLIENFGYGFVKGGDKIKVSRGYKNSRGRPIKRVRFGELARLK